jgi:hypothetical protein
MLRLRLPGEFAEPLVGRDQVAVDAKPDMFEGFTMYQLKIVRHKRSYLTGVTIPTTGTPEKDKQNFLESIAGIYYSSLTRVMLCLRRYIKA